MRRIFSATFQALIAFSVTIVPVVASADIATPAVQQPGQQGLYRAGQLSKAGSGLARAFLAHQSRSGQAPFVPSDRFLPYVGGRVLVEARATASASELLADLRGLGLTDGLQYENLVSGYLPLAAVGEAVSLSSLRSIAAAIEPVRSAGAVTSEGDTALRADIARSAFALDGAGVAVGVLSDSYNSLQGAAADIASGDLPATGVQVLNESTACGTLIFCIDEGRAMLQIIHDIAPGAYLMFHTGLASKPEYATGIEALAAAGADVIVDDLLYLNEPMFQDGVIAGAVDNVTAGGAIYYSAAGNAGKESYEGTFADSGEVLCIEFFFPLGDCDPIYERVGRMHDFDSGSDVDNYLHVTVPINGVLTVAMQWNEPFNSPRIDHDLVLLDETGQTYYTISANDNISMGEGWEVLQFENSEFLYQNTEYALAITYDDVDSIDPPAGHVKLVVFGSSNTINEHHTNSATVFGHANAKGATAVGAAYWENTPAFGTVPPTLEPYSSRGGTPIWFEANGTSKAAPEVRPKPEITAVDGVGTTFFFSDTDNDGIDEFFGTSAAAPHAAGIAALLLEANPGSTGGQVNSALEATAIDMEAAGFDFDSGAGLVQADDAIAALTAAAGNLPPAAGFTFSGSDLAVDFASAGTDGDGSIVAWQWDFGDGGTDTASNPSHAYAVAGTYRVMLTVTDDDGATDIIGQLVTVGAGGSGGGGSGGGGNAAPVAAFSYSCSARDCSFDSSASSDDAGIVSWSWDFGDGNGSTDQNPTHSYGSQGNYTVSLTVADVEGENDSASASFRIKNRGNASGSAGGDGGGGDGGTDSGGSEKGRKKCSDGIDNDGDGLIDGADPDC
jgi:PKD repeat protein